jgi:hypothetical protein
MHVVKYAPFLGTRSVFESWRPHTSPASPVPSFINGLVKASSTRSRPAAGDLFFVGISKHTWLRAKYVA